MSGAKLFSSDIHVYVAYFSEFWHQIHSGRPKQARSTAMMIVTADGEADYGMPNTAPILRCHLWSRVLSLHYEEQHVII